MTLSAEFLDTLRSVEGSASAPKPNKVKEGGAELGYHFANGCHIAVCTEREFYT